jgi:CheY-like chemotaxis protein
MAGNLQTAGHGGRIGDRARTALCLLFVMDIDDASENCKILVVDDNVDAADTLVSLLSLFGYPACAVYGGEAAILAAEALHPKLVFLDIDMPGLDGYETATCIRNAEPGSDIEIVALTARSSQADRLLSVNMGFALHVQKPIGSKQLCQLAEHAYPRK